MALQVSAGSTLGALALRTGAIVCDHGWLRLLGAGTEDLPGLAEANGLSSERQDPPSALTVAYDVLGGRFAIDGGELSGTPGEVCYFGPDTLEWTPIGGGHTAFVHWVLEGGTAEFYTELRWADWEKESVALSLGQGISRWARASNAAASPQVAHSHSARFRSPHRATLGLCR